MDLLKEYDEPNENRYWEYSHVDNNKFNNSILIKSYQNTTKDDPFASNMDFIPIED